MKGIPESAIPRLTRPGASSSLTAAAVSEQ